jgi:hypothetical protein
VRAARSDQLFSRQAKYLRKRYPLQSPSYDGGAQIGHRTSQVRKNQQNIKSSVGGMPLRITKMSYSLINSLFKTVKDKKNNQNGKKNR